MRSLGLDDRGRRFCGGGSPTARSSATSSLEPIDRLKKRGQEGFLDEIFGNFATADPRRCKPIERIAVQFEPLCRIRRRRTPLLGFRVRVVFRTFVGVMMFGSGSFLMESAVTDAGCRDARHRSPRNVGCLMHNGRLFILHKDGQSQILLVPGGVKCEVENSRSLIGGIQLDEVEPGLSGGNRANNDFPAFSPAGISVTTRSSRSTAQLTEATLSREPSCV